MAGATVDTGTSDTSGLDGADVSSGDGAPLAIDARHWATVQITTQVMGNTATQDDCPEANLVGFDHITVRFAGGDTVELDDVQSNWCHGFGFGAVQAIGADSAFSDIVDPH